MQDSVTTCVPDCALSVTFSAAEYELLAAGLKVTLMVQMLPAESELPQFDAGVSVNADAFVPVIEIPVSNRGVAPAFWSVTVLVVLVFTACVPRLRFEVPKLAWGSITVAVTHDRLRIAWRIVRNGQGRCLRCVEGPGNEGNRSRAVTPRGQRFRAQIELHKFGGVPTLHD